MFFRKVPFITSYVFAIAHTYAQVQTQQISAEAQRHIEEQLDYPIHHELCELYGYDAIPHMVETSFVGDDTTTVVEWMVVEKIGKYLDVGFYGLRTTNGVVTKSLDKITRSEFFEEYLKECTN